MKKGCLVFCAAALLALMLVGCGKTAQEAAVLEPEPEAIEATVVLAEVTSPVEPEPEEIPEPEPLPEGAEILLFGARVSTLTDGKTLFVDCALLEKDGIVVLDFKTDHVTESTVAAAAERYRLQVQTYAEALSRIYEMPVKAKYLYFFQLGRFVEV